MSVYVVFFGGYLSDQPAIDQWLASANNVCGGDVGYDAFPFPDGVGPDDDDAVGGFRQFDAVIKKINDTGAEMTYIVGHSSGCAIANKVDSLLTKGMKDTSHISLVCLDGFLPSEVQRNRPNTQVWSAVGAKGGQSLHYRSWAKPYTSAQATQEISLHFSLVNTAATDAITGKNYKKTGYAGCIANLCWLN